MSLEAEFKTAMEADATLMAVLTGGVYTSAEAGRDGITRTDTPGAFSDYLLPCALVKQRGLLPDFFIEDSIEQMASTVQIVEIWLYEDSGYTNIDLALAQLFITFFGNQLNGSFELTLINTIDRETDSGQLNGASMARQDWQVNKILGA